MFLEYNFETVYVYYDSWSSSTIEYFKVSCNLEAQAWNTLHSMYKVWIKRHYETYKGWFLSWMWWFLHFTLLHGDYILPNFLWDKFYLKFQPFKSWFSFPCQTLSPIIILNSDPDENCFVFIRGWLQNNFKKSSLNIAAFIGQNK